MQKEIRIGDVYYVDDIRFGSTTIKIVGMNLQGEICFDQIYILINNETLYGTHYYEDINLFKKCSKKKKTKKFWYKLLRKHICNLKLREEIPF